MKPRIISNARNFLRYALLSLPLFLFTFCQNADEDIVFVEQAKLTKDSKIVSLMLGAVKNDNSKAALKSSINTKEVQCTEIQYPIEFELYYTENKLPKPMTVNSDDELRDFLNTLTEDNGFYISFPLTLLGEDDEFEFYNLEEFEGTLEAVTKACAADDDDDDDDDDDSDDDDIEYDFCHKNNRKVYICHKGRTICVCIEAIWGHLSNHNEDYLGQCN